MPVQITNKTGGDPLPASKELEVEFFTSPEVGPVVGENLEVEFGSPDGSPSAPPAASAALPATEEDLEVELEEVSEEGSSGAAPSSAASAPADMAVSAKDLTKELVSIYVLAMHLPSPDILATDYTDNVGNVVRRVKEWSGLNRDKARIIENMRRNIYRRIERIWCMVREFGVWLTVSEEGVREAERLMREVRDTLRKIGLDQIAHRYFVKAIRIYLHPEDAKMLLDAAVSQLTAEIQELGRRIKDAEAARNRRLVRELLYKREYTKALLDIFKKYMEDISR
jgi:hypothetical protein